MEKKEQRGKGGGEQGFVFYEDEEWKLGDEGYREESGFKGNVDQGQIIWEYVIFFQVCEWWGEVGREGRCSVDYGVWICIRCYQSQQVNLEGIF